jgi:hypothetical protein
MGFKIVEGTPSEKWFPISAGTGPTGNTCYIGQIVKWQTGGILPLGAAAANPDVTYFPFGIVTGITDRNGGTFSSTYQAVGTSQVITQATALARDFFGQEGMWAKNQANTIVKVAILDPTCVIEGPIKNAAIGTAPGVVTCTTASTDGLSSMVHGNADVATVANNNMYYCRSGANAGFYNSSYAASQTTPTFYTPWQYDWAVGDTFCVTNVGLGRQKIQFDSASMWIENSAALTSYYFMVDVLSMDLSQSGKESAQFKFCRQGY